MDPHADLDARIDGAFRRARESHDQDVVDEMNDLLSEGYAMALRDEQRLMELEQRMVDALLSHEPGRDRDVGVLLDEMRCVARTVARLRARLASMHERYLALRAS